MAHRPSRIARPAAGIVATLALALAADCSGKVVRPEDRAERQRLPVRRVQPSRDRFEKEFRSRLAAGHPDTRFVALVDLTEQLDLHAFSRRLRRSAASKADRRSAVISALEAVAARQQERLFPLIDRLASKGAVGYAHPVAIVNRVVVEGTAAALFEIGSSEEVARVVSDSTSERAASTTKDGRGATRAPPGPSFTSWAIAAMGADRLWSLGWDGRGVVVATIDTGAYEGHEQLRGRRVPGERGWFDPVEGSAIGSDRHGHGTGVLSQAVGSNPDRRVVGVAPGARWAAALGNWKNVYSRSRMTLAADWALRVARPDVLINAWSHDEGECNDFDRPFIDAWKASGIFVAFSAGNGGPLRASGESPAQLAGIFPDGGPVFSVAALDEAGDASPLSSRGPSRCGSGAFPSLAAPGAGLPIASNGDPEAYVWGEGTSLSVGLVGGAAALLLQAAPETDPETLERVLIASARDVAPSGRDDATGQGAVDLPAALAMLLSPERR